MKYSCRWLLPLMLTPSLALADVPRVAVDIAPVQSLAAQVMGDLGTPEMVMPPGASPHGYSMRPSEASTLDNADVVFWVGPPLTPWLADAIKTLSDDADAVALLDAPGTTRLDYREGATFEAHNHDHGHGHEHEHDDGHDHEHAHDGGHDHEHAHDGGHDHGHTGLNPHAWLDPDNARVWLKVMADTLARTDPEHADIYHDNARNAQKRIDQLVSTTEKRLADDHNTRFIVFHDAYQYFEERFDVHAAGAISIGDASSPGPARIRELQEKVTSLNVQCIFSEPQFNPRMIESIFGNMPVNTSIVLDPLGAGMAPGPGLYDALITHIANSIDECAESSTQKAG
ncbi:zinc ABC transporter substrate-binding protein [Kushneria konosiri]|uniref:High-affinity zinc uptake system protein ZnuA n=1 Tax=Kushneria konosiri TaxID=698828 RepID=A0A2Z2H5Z4_9GAMM|nr:zinc ABC transporter substrate-binding protein [Kushneria konosiri]ARS52822.1 zinc transporter [Kushneria konosiri]